MPSVIKDITHLNKLLHIRKKYNFYFNFKELSKEDNKYWLEKIEKNYDACGCGTGKIFTIISLMVSIAYAFYLSKISNQNVSITFYISTFIFVIIFSLIGKLFGKIIAYKRLKNDILILKNKVLENQNISC